MVTPASPSPINHQCHAAGVSTAAADTSDGEETASATGSKRKKNGREGAQTAKRSRKDIAEERDRYALFLQSLQPPKGTWTKVDELMFKKGHAIFGADHCSVAEFVGSGKTCKQVRGRQISQTSSFLPGCKVTCTTSVLTPSMLLVAGFCVSPVECGIHARGKRT